MIRRKPKRLDGDPVDGRQYTVYTDSAWGEQRQPGLCRFYKAGCSASQQKKRYRFIGEDGKVIAGVTRYEESK